MKTVGSRIRESYGVNSRRAMGKTIQGVYSARPNRVEISFAAAARARYSFVAIQSGRAYRCYCRCIKRSSRHRSFVGRHYEISACKILRPFTRNCGPFGSGSAGNGCAASSPAPSPSSSPPRALAARRYVAQACPLCAGSGPEALRKTLARAHAQGRKGLTPKDVGYTSNRSSLTRLFASPRMELFHVRDTY
jgi:hypothetical protein